MMLRGWVDYSQTHRTTQTAKALSTLATIVADFGDCCRIRRQLPFSATVAEFGGDKLSPFPATIVAEFGDYSRQS